MELKWSNTVLNLSVSNTGTFTDLTALSVGTNGITRIGQSVNLKDIRLKSQSIVADTTNGIRVIIFKWFPSNTADVPSASELLLNSSSYISNFLPYKPSRFKILYDNYFTLDTYRPIKDHDVKVKLSGSAQFDLSVDTGSHHIYHFVFSDSGAASHPSYAADILLRFTD